MTGSLKPDKPIPPATWTAAHLAELERAFPERTDAASSDALHFRTGQRSVVKYVQQAMLRKGPV